MLTFSVACQSSGGEGEGGLEPAYGPCSGYYPVTVDLSVLDLRAEEIEEVRFGGVLAYGLSALADDHVQVTVQGHASCGPVDVVLHTKDGERTHPAGFRYLAPQSAYFERVVGIGASLGQGVQGGVPTAHGVLMSPLAQVVRQAGGFMPLPALIEPLFPQISPQEVGDPPDCPSPDVVTFVATQIMGSISAFTDPESGDFSFDGMREDPDVEVMNLSVGNAKVVHLLHGLPPDDLAANFLGHLVYDPHGEILAPLPDSPVERVERLEPTMIMSTDLYGNDVLRPLLNDPEPMTAEELASIAEALGTVLDRLAATEAQVFVANLPDPSLLPAAKRHLKEVEAEELADVEAFLTSLQQAALYLNAITGERAATHPNLHVVDLMEPVAEISANGLMVGDQRLGAERFGGIVGLDGVHFTDTGYAFLANLFIAKINEVLGTDVRAISLAPVLAMDPESPAALRAAGVAVDECQ
ncbi:MAG: hypothetical protein CL940_10820 [Deltaproteobacteria bacterium]|nr:hypothetical protein [Deltaproteobacteria bacterium]